MAPSLEEKMSDITATESMPDAFHKLVSNVSKILGPSSGLTCEDVNVADLQRLMESYVSSENEWKKYAFVDYSRGYTRNLVDKGNGKSNLVSSTFHSIMICVLTFCSQLVLVWSPGKGSPVHGKLSANMLCSSLCWNFLPQNSYEPLTNSLTPLLDHADSHCLMKVLRGTLKETRYDFPKNAKTPPKVIKETLFQENQVTYMSDELGIHKVTNPDLENVAVSLHRKSKDEPFCVKL